MFSKSVRFWQLKHPFFHPVRSTNVCGKTIENLFYYGLFLIDLLLLGDITLFIFQSVICDGR